MARTAPSKAESPKAESPKAESPKAESPKAESPKAESPKAESPKAESPTSGRRRGKVLQAGDQGEHAGAIPRQGSRPRAERQAQRREAILAAALDEFSARGFAATRLDDVAKRADVAKGTIYLYFRDKESLFQELVRTMLSPVISRVAAAPMIDLPARMVVEGIADMFVREVFGTRRQDVIRLIITEGQRFPKLAEIYYREVIARVVPAIRALMTRAVARGELPNDALARFPQLLAAPAMVALMWNGLFGRFDRIDVREILQAHIDMLFGERKAS